MNHPIQMTSRVRTTLDRILSFQKLSDLNSLIDRKYAISTIYDWIRKTDEGRNIGPKSLETYCLLYEEATSTGKSIDQIIKEQHVYSLNQILDDVQLIKEIPDVINDIGVLDDLISTGKKIAISEEMITAKDVIMAIRTKDDLVTNYRDKMMSRLYKMEERIRKIIEIISQELPDQYKEAIAMRFKKEFGDEQSL